MRVAPAFVVVLAVASASGCGSASNRPAPLLAYSNGPDLVLYEPAKGSRRIVVAGNVRSDEWVGGPAWSPGGEQLAYVRWGTPIRLHVVDAATGRGRSVGHALGDWGSDYDPHWSPDARWIAYRDVARGELWVARSNGSRERLVLRNRMDVIGIAGWTRDNRLAILVGARSRDERGALLAQSWKRLVVSPEGGQPRPFVGRWPSPPLSPDGQRLAVERDPNGNDQVAVLAGRRPVERVTDYRTLSGHVPVRIAGLRWSPDRRWIAFVRNGAVVVVRSDGTGEQRLLEDGTIADWSPDGRYLLVVGTLGARSLWLFEPEVERRRLVSRWFGRSGVLFEPGDWAWRPQGAPPTASRTPGRPARRDVETPFASSQFRKGRVGIRAARNVGDEALAWIDALSPDGRFAAVKTRVAPYSSRLEVLDLASGSRRRVGTLAAPWQESAGFSPSGRELLFRRRHELWRVRVTGGPMLLVTRDAGPGPYRWLRDGRIAYVDQQRRLVFVTPAGRRRVGFRVTPELGNLAVAPGGEHVLYARGCDVWLRDLRSGRVRRFVHGSFSPTPESWSPRGDRIALAVSRYFPACSPADFDWYHAGTALFDLRGKRLDSLPGGAIGWSADGRFLLTSGGVTGTSTTTAQPLVLDDLRARRQSMLMPFASTGQAWVLSGGRIVFGRYEDPEAVQRGGDPRPQLYSGTLSPTP